MSAAATPAPTRHRLAADPKFGKRTCPHCKCCQRTSGDTCLCCDKSLTASVSAPTAIYALASRFVYDHWARDLPEHHEAVSVKVRDAGSRVHAELDRLGYDELMADARYYADEMGVAGFEDAAMIGSARRVVASLEKAGPPA